MKIFNPTVISFLLLSFFACNQASNAQEFVKDVATQLKKEPGTIVDVRTSEEWNSGHHTKAIHADWLSDDFRKKAATWDKNKTYYLHCAAGGRSSDAVEYMKKNGFKKVYNLGGYDGIKNLK
ncbi:MAG: rhodanese-like domain-containing protein [Saprospiraceae bacterium]|nr:rhodanese-like domain-containing protein [Saprospiraceae bacterium]